MNIEFCRHLCCCDCVIFRHSILQCLVIPLAWFSHCAVLSYKLLLINLVKVVLDSILLPYLINKQFYSCII